MKAILISRVSTEEQKEVGNSLPAQIARLEKYCRNKGLEILKNFSFDESSYTNERGEFSQISSSLNSGSFDQSGEVNSQTRYNFLDLYCAIKMTSIFFGSSLGRLTVIQSRPDTSLPCSRKVTLSYSTAYCFCDA